MKSIPAILIAIILGACIGLRPSELNNKSFKSQPFHMVGATRIMFFDDSLFLLQKRDGMMFSKGVWKRSSDEKSIILNSFTSCRPYQGDTALYFELANEKLKIIKNKLLIKGVVLTEAPIK